MKLFLFPIGQTLLYPGTSKPLQIFEPRYLKMIQDSLDQRVPVALGLVDEPSVAQESRIGTRPEFVREIVGYGFPQVMEHRPDGSLLVLLPGQGKARLRQVIDLHEPYLIVEGEKVLEDLDLSAQYHDSYITLQKMLLSWIGTHIPDSRLRDEFRRQLRTPDQVLGCVAAYLLSDLDLQQVVLEANSIDEKVLLLSSILAQGVPAAS